MTDVTRSVLQWHGGKWMLAPWIISYFPPHDIYVEPFSGAASVLMQKKRSRIEVYNDLDEQVVNLFRVIRNPKTAAQLIRALSLTPYSLTEYKQAYKYTADPVESARRSVIRSFMGFGAKANNIDGKVVSWRIRTSAKGIPIADEWSKYPPSLQAVTNRLADVMIHNCPAIEVMKQFDSSKTLHYLDPPYLPSTRTGHSKSRNNEKKIELATLYNHEMSYSDHKKLLKFIQTLNGFVILSGYPSKLYDDMLDGWTRFEKKVTIGHRRENKPTRIEVLWLSPSVMKARRSLFKR